MFLIIGESTYKYRKWEAGKNSEMLDWNWWYQYELILSYVCFILVCFLVLKMYIFYIF